MPTQKIYRENYLVLGSLYFEITGLYYVDENGNLSFIIKTKLLILNFSILFNSIFY